MNKQPRSLDLTIFQECFRKDLAKHLKFLEGTKDLFFDEELMKPFDLIAGATFLKSHGVDKIYKLQAGGIEAGSDKRMFIVRPYASRMKLIAELINFDKVKEIKRQYHIVLTPKRLTCCDLLLEQEGIYGDVTIEEFPVDFFQLDEDLLSLEMPLCYKQFYTEKDTTWFNSIARALVSLQGLFGRFTNSHCIGSSAGTLFKLMQLMTTATLPATSEIGSLFIVDRDLDYASLLCSQLTYEGLVSEIFGIRSGVVDFKIGEQSMKMRLDSADRVFHEIRGLHISSIFPLLSHKAKMIQVGYDKRNDLDSVSELKAFVSDDLRKLKQQHKSLEQHINSCEHIMNKRKNEKFEECLQVEQCLLDDSNTKDCLAYVEKCINRQASPLQCLRLMCLFSVCKGGLDNKLHRSLKLQYLQSFGYNHLLTFKALKEAGLYTENSDKRNLFPRAKKKFNLIPKDPDAVNRGTTPSDVSYVFGGAYTPFLVKLISQILSKRPVDEALNAVGVTSLKHEAPVSARQGGSNTQSASCTAVVVFLGGCTHTEVNALRFIGQQMGCRFIILTTAVVTATDVLSTLVVKSNY